MAKTENKYWIYLEELRRSGITNMFGAVPYLTAEFEDEGMTRKQASEILADWMRNYDREDYE